MVSVAASGSTLWVCDPSLGSYALEQAEMLRSPDYRHKCHAPFKCAPTVYEVYEKTKVELRFKLASKEFIVS